MLLVPDYGGKPHFGEFAFKTVTLQRFERLAPGSTGKIGFSATSADPPSACRTDGGDSEYTLDTRIEVGPLSAGTAARPHRRDLANPSSDLGVAP